MFDDIGVHGTNAGNYIYSGPITSTNKQHTFKVICTNLQKACSSNTCVPLYLYGRQRQRAGREWYLLSSVSCTL